MPAQHRRQFLATLLLASAAFVPALARPGRLGAASVDAAIEGWLAQQFKMNDAPRRTAPTGAPDALALAIASWDWLRRTPRLGQEPPLDAATEFLAKQGNWPGAAAIRRRSEAQAADMLKASDDEARRFFRALPPQSAAGEARLALLSSGKEAEALAKKAWVRPYLPLELESALLRRFGPVFTPADHAARASAVIWVGQTSAATRLLPLLAPDDNACATARLALRSGAANGPALADALPARFRQRAALALDRVLWFEKKNRMADAEALLAAGGTDPGASNPVAWLDKRLEIGRAAMRRGDNDLARRILANHNSYAEGTDLAARPLIERIRLSDTEWLAGWIALRKLGKPDLAFGHFSNFDDAVTTPISKTRGHYWLGRTEEALGNKDKAASHYGKAAQHMDYYYGQLAVEALGQKPALPFVPRIDIRDAEQQRFEAQPMPRAIRILNAMGDDTRTSAFIRALANAAETPKEARLTAELGRRIDRPDLGVWTWKSARADNDLSVFDLAYPRLPETAPILPGDRILAHAIARQESSFDAVARSPAGARGLMQLMPATAKDIASRLGRPYDEARLLSDRVYNVELGAWYISKRREEFQSRPLAIAAYNAGAGNVRKWLTLVGDPRNGFDPIDWVEMIPFSETRNYVQRVIENAVVYSLIEPQRPDAEPRASRWLGTP